MSQPAASGKANSNSNSSLSHTATLDSFLPSLHAHKHTGTHHSSAIDSAFSGRQLWGSCVELVQHCVSLTGASETKVSPTPNRVRVSVCARVVMPVRRICRRCYIFLPADCDGAAVAAAAAS